MLGLGIWCGQIDVCEASCVCGGGRAWSLRRYLSEGSCVYASPNHRRLIELVWPGGCEASFLSLSLSLSVCVCVCVCVAGPLMGLTILIQRGEISKIILRYKPL